MRFVILGWSPGLTLPLAGWSWPSLVPSVGIRFLIYKIPVLSARIKRSNACENDLSMGMHNTELSLSSVLQMERWPHRKTETTEPPEPWSDSIKPGACTSQGTACLLDSAYTCTHNRQASNRLKASSISNATLKTSRFFLQNNSMPTLKMVKIKWNLMRTLAYSKIQSPSVFQQHGRGPGRACRCICWVWWGKHSWKEALRMKAWSGGS